MKKIAALLLAAFSNLCAQNKWTLQECISYALSHNISLKQASISNDINRNNADQSVAASLPSINAGINHIYNIGKTIDRFTNTFADNQVALSQNFYLSSNLVLWSGFSQYNNIKASRYNYLSGVEQLKQQENDLSLTVANAYIGVIFADELLKISQGQFDITKEQFDRTSKLVAAGAMAKSIEFDIRAQMANDEVNVTTAENNLQLSLLNLRQLMNLDSTSNFMIDRPQLDVSENTLLAQDVQLIYETSLKNQPGIKSGEYTILSAEKGLASARGRRSPTLAFNASLGTGTSGLAKDLIGFQYSGYQVSGITSRGDSVYTPVAQPLFRDTPFSEQFKNNVNKSIGFSLTIPLFNGLQTHTAVKNAKLNAYSARLSQDLQKQNLYKNIAQAYANARAALNKYNATRLSIDAANESFKYAQQKFTAGVISAFDFRPNTITYLN
jgi:outer membrane protein